MLLLVVLVPFLTVPGAAGQDAPEPVLPRVAATTVHPLDHPGTVVTTERVPLIELFTATWCPVCAEAERALDRVLEERRTGPVPALVAYHPWPDLEDPFGYAEGHQRMVDHYGAVGFPTLWVDGTWEETTDDGPSTVDAGLEEIFYHRITGMLERSLETRPDFALRSIMTIDGGVATVHLEVRPLTGRAGELVVRGVLWEDHIHFPGSNGIDDHRMTAHASLTAQELPYLPPGGDWSTTWQVALPRDMDLQQSGITVWVEERETEAETLQPERLMGFALGVGMTSATAVFLLRRHDRRRPPPEPRKEREED